MPIVRRRDYLHRGGRRQNRSVPALLGAPDVAFFGSQRCNTSKKSSRRRAVGVRENLWIIGPDCLIRLAAASGFHHPDEPLDRKCVVRRGVCFDTGCAGNGSRTNGFRSGPKGRRCLCVFEMWKSCSRNCYDMPQLRRELPLSRAANQSARVARHSFVRTRPPKSEVLYPTIVSAENFPR